MRKAYQIHQVRIKCGPTRCTVSRPSIVAKSGDRVRFHNGCRDTIYIQVSHEKLFAPPQFKVSAGQDRVVRVRKVLRGVYPYAVFCRKNARFCVGSSMPIIIVPR